LTIASALVSLVMSPRCRVMTAATCKDYVFAAMQASGRPLLLLPERAP
jgi:hypothetical protein